MRHTHCAHYQGFNIILVHLNAYAFHYRFHGLIRNDIFKGDLLPIYYKGELLPRFVTGRLRVRSRVIPKTLKMVQAALSLGAQH